MKQAKYNGVLTKMGQADPARQLQVGKTKLDSDSVCLFLLEAISVNAGQRLDQRGLAMVDMSGRAEDEVFHLYRLIFLATSNIAIPPATEALSEPTPP